MLYNAYALLTLRDEFHDIDILFGNFDCEFHLFFVEISVVNFEDYCGNFTFNKRALGLDCVNFLIIEVIVNN